MDKAREIDSWSIGRQSGGKTKVAYRRTKRGKYKAGVEAVKAGREIELLFI